MQARGHSKNGKQNRVEQNSTLWGIMGGEKTGPKEKKKRKKEKRKEKGTTKRIMQTRFSFSTSIQWGIITKNKMPVYACFFQKNKGNGCIYFSLMIIHTQSSRDS